MNKQASNVVIDRLVLDGLDFEPGDAERIGTRVESELVQLLENAQMLDRMQDSAVDALTSGDIAIESSHSFARHLAQNIVGSIRTADS